MNICKKLYANKATTPWPPLPPIAQFGLQQSCAQIPLAAGSASDSSPISALFMLCPGLPPPLTQRASGPLFWIFTSQDKVA